VVVDFVLGAGDAGAEFRHPVVLLAGPQIYVVSALLAEQRARFAGCPGSCERGSNWLAGTVRPESSGVLFTAAVLTAQGLHVLYDGQRSLRYAMCPGLCYDSTRWQTTDVDSASGVGWFPAIATDGADRLHAVYTPGNLSQLHYAECSAACLNSGSWGVATIDRADFVLYPAIAVDGDNRVHVLYHAGFNQGTGPQGLKYATCLSGCADPANWSVTLVDEFSAYGPPYDAAPALIIGSSNRIHAAYWTPTGVRYATCASSCSSLASWAIGTVATITTMPSHGSIALAIGPTGTLHLLYPDRAARYATCSAACTTEAAWQIITADSTGSGPDYVTLAVDSLDHPHMVLSETARLRYVWRQQ